MDRTLHKFPMVRSNARALTTSATPVWQPWQRKLATLPGEVLTISMYGDTLDQGQHGDCAAVSSRKARMTARGLAGLAVVPISYFAQYDQARVLMGTMGQDSGETSDAMVRVYEEYGAIPESLYPETDQDFNQAPPANLWDASWKLKPTQVFHTTSLQDYKDACASGYPVLIAFEVFDELESGIVAQTGWLPMPSNPLNSIGGHEEVGGGYSDSVGAVLVGNQWTDNWGIHNDSRLKGCHWMSYEYFEKYVWDIIIFAPDNDVTPPIPATPATFTKPELDVYDVKVVWDKNQYAEGETTVLAVLLTQNGQPLSDQSVDVQFDVNENIEFETSFTSDSNGQLLASYAFQFSGNAVATVRWYTPYGDLIEKNVQTTIIGPNPAPNPFKTSIKFDKPSYTFGESATITVGLTCQGSAMIGAVLTVAMSDGTSQDVTTDNTVGNGEATFHWSPKTSGSYTATVSYESVQASATATWVTTPSTQLWHVQVEADKLDANANATAEKVRAAGFSVFIKKEADGLEHVQVGAFKEKPNAIALQQKLIAAGFKTAFLKFE